LISDAFNHDTIFYEGEGEVPATTQYNAKCTLSKNAIEAVEIILVQSRTLA
jgi:hypothetical protein